MQESTSGRLSGWLWPILSLVLAALVIYLSYQNFQLKKQLTVVTTNFSRSIPIPESGRTAAPITAYLPDGQEMTIRTDSLSAPIVLAWLSPDCEPCVESIEWWNRLSDQYPGQVWGISRESRNAFAGTLAEGHDIRVMIVTPVSDTVFDQYQVYATPVTMVIGTNGAIQNVWPGEMTADKNDAIIGLMGQPYAERR